MKRETTNHAKHTNEGDADLRSPISDLGPQASGARIAMLTAMALAGMLAVAVWGQMPSADSKVTHRTGPYRIQNAVLDAEAETTPERRRTNPTADADRKLPKSLTYTDGIMTIKRDFTPPDGWSFATLRAACRPLSRAT